MGRGSLAEISESSRAEGQKEQDRNLSSAKIGDAVLGRNGLARWRKSRRRSVEA